MTNNAVARKLAYCLPFTLFTTPAVHASFDDELQALLAEETAVATQQKMNADFVPGMVTVLHSDQLLARGLRTVSEALNSVAGFYSTVNNRGDEVTIVRGIGATLRGTNLKILINGVSVNRAIDSSADWAKRLPLRQIDRIEVIRGPGSVIYGEYALSAVVNIILRDDTSVGLELGNHQHTTIDGSYYKNWENGSIQINAAAWDEQASGLPAAADNFSLNGLGFYPAQVHDQEKGELFVLNTQYKKLSMAITHNHIKRGAGHGATANLGDNTAPHVEKYNSLTLKHEWQLAENLQMNTQYHLQHSDIEIGEYLPIPRGVNPPFTDGPILVTMYRQDSNAELSQQLQTEWHWQFKKNHQLYSQLGYSHVEVTDSKRFNRIEGQPAMQLADDSALVAQDARRNLTYWALQDQWQIADNIQLTAGFRVDHYSSSTYTTPRLAAVWQFTNTQILKAQYSESFRPPTLEQGSPGGNSYPGAMRSNNLKEERLSSREISYIYHGATQNLRLTAFATNVKDVLEFYLRPGSPPLWRNFGDLRTTGAEAEWQQQVGRNWKWYANASYVDVEDRAMPDATPSGVVNWLGETGIQWQSDTWGQHNITLKHVGKQSGWATINNRLQNSAYFSGYNTLDYAITFPNSFGVAALQLSTGVRNLLDKQHRTTPNPNQYPKGLVDGERTLWMRISYEY